jgi:hypothetical protein
MWRIYSNPDPQGGGYFKKEDFLHKRVDSCLINNMRTSCKQYKEVLERKRKEEDERKKTQC